jgi:hypothetical protein
MASRTREGDMQRALLLLVPLAFSMFPSLTRAQNKPPLSNLPSFLAGYDRNFPVLETLFAELANENLPLRDEEGRPLGRRPIEDRRQALSDLRGTARQLAANPQDLVLAARLVTRTENLADDLFSLSQVAYDNDREELGKRLADLQLTMDRNREFLETCLLALAAQTQERLIQLEAENEALRRNLKQAGTQPPAKPDCR